MKGYELVVLVHPDHESEIEKALTVVRDLVKNNGGTITTEENWGKKRLAYPIRNENFAVYVAMDLELPATAPLKISNTLNITDSVLRYLLVTIDEKGRKALEEAKNRQSDAPTEEE